MFLLDLSGSGKKIGSAFKTWINNSLASGLPTAVEAYLATPPAGKPGLLFRSDPNKHLFIKVGALSGSHNQFEGDERGTRFDLRDASIAALSLGWKTDDPTKAHPGVYKVGIIHNFGHFPRFGSQALTHGDDVAFGNIIHYGEGRSPMVLLAIVPSTPN